MYPSFTGGTIGALLRGIQEDKSQGPLAAPPETQPSSPIRGMVQQPVMQTEAPDSSRMIAVRPETAPITGGDSSSQIVAPVSAPVASEAPSVEPVAPVAPAAPAPSTASPSSPVAPTVSRPSTPVSAPAASPNFSAPRISTPSASLATTIRPSSLPITGGNSRPTPSPDPYAMYRNVPGGTISAPKQQNVGGYALTNTSSGMRMPNLIGAALSGLQLGTMLANKILPQNAPQGLISRLTGGFLGYRGRR